MTTDDDSRPEPGDQDFFARFTLSSATTSALPLSVPPAERHHHELFTDRKRHAPQRTRISRLPAHPRYIELLLTRRCRDSGPRLLGH